MSIVVKFFCLLLVLLIVVFVVVWLFLLLVFGVCKELWSFQIVFFLLVGFVVIVVVLLVVSGIVLLMVICCKNDRVKYWVILFILVLSILVGILFNFGIKVFQVFVIYDIFMDWENLSDFFDFEGQWLKDVNLL